jgi:hypothetical protein
LPRTGGRSLGHVLRKANRDPSPAGDHGGCHSFEATPAILDAVREVDRQLRQLAPVLLAPCLPIQTPWGNGLPTGPATTRSTSGGRWTLAPGTYRLSGTRAAAAVRKRVS